MIERHGEALEYDLHHELHIDIHDFFRGTRSWVEFYRLIYRLPAYGHFKAGLLDNEDDAAELLKRGEAATFGMHGWTYERELLSSLVEAVRAMHSTLVAVNSKGHKGFTVKPLPRPVTAMDRLKKRQRWHRHDELVAKVLPQRTTT
ncbi:MAG TPA: hypothetical protein VFX53_17125 [Pedococcus sp.]|nr:hypothetical protein [Pedococcus sp.]